MWDMGRPKIAAYYFPNYHADARNQQIHGHNWTEWELVKAASPRWPGHHQPNIPVWGYADEANPAEMAKKIDAAANHGVDAFIFDWYWYNDGPFLQRGLDEGYCRAPNRHRVKFALMWANHDWTDIHPKKLTEVPRVLYPGAITRETFDQVTAHVIGNYFSSPSYWCVDGCPYFSIYDLPRLILGLGGVAATVAALRQLRLQTRAAGHPDIHLNLVLWQRGILAGEESMNVTSSLLTELGFDSITSYVWVHHVPIVPFPVMPYLECWEKIRSYFAEVTATYPNIPYYPNVTMGWDASPRTTQSDTFENSGYPFMGSLGNNTPANFKRVLIDLQNWLTSRPPQQRILTINAWNEWTEGSYLEPDMRNGSAYLEAIREVFGTNGAARDGITSLD